MTKRWLWVPLAFFALAGWAFGEPALTEVQKLRAQVQMLNERVLQLEYQLSTCTAQQQALRLAESRRVLERDVPPGFTLDWQTLTLKPAVIEPDK